MSMVSVTGQCGLTIRDLFLLQKSSETVFSTLFFLKLVSIQDQHQIVSADVGGPSQSRVSWSLGSNK